jgi:hypothetical protein
LKAFRNRHLLAENFVKRPLARPQRNGALSAVPPLALGLGVDFVFKRGERQQGAHFTDFLYRS